MAPSQSQHTQDAVTTPSAGEGSLALGVSLALRHKTRGAARPGGCLPELPSLPVADVAFQSRGQCTVAQLAGKGAFSGDKLAPPPPHVVALDQ